AGAGPRRIGSSIIATIWLSEPRLESPARTSHVGTISEYRYEAVQGSQNAASPLGAATEPASIVAAGLRPSRELGQQSRPLPLAVDLGEVRLDRALAHVQRSGDFAVGGALCGEFGDAFLCKCQSFGRDRAPQPDSAELVARACNPHGGTERFERRERLPKCL